MNSPLVTVSIPTYNSAKTIKESLQSVMYQSYKNIDINVVDKNSQDQTINVIKKLGIKNIKRVEGSLLKARYEGIKSAKGKYVLILDSDQILKPDSIKKAVKLAEKKKYKMLVFEEKVYKTDTFIEKLFDLDRKVINTICNLSPYTGVIMPRFFETKLLRKAYNKIPKKLYKNTGGPDHAIVYYESWKLSKNVGIVSDAVKHREPSSFRQLLKKFYRWGYTSLDAHLAKYKDLMNKKERFRSGLFTKGLFVESVGSVFLVMLKGVAFKTGYYMAIIDKFLGFRRKY